MFNIDNITYNEAEDVIKFFLARMDMDQRHEFMATYPVHYSKMFPESKSDILGDMVQNHIDGLRAAKKAKS